MAEPAPRRILVVNVSRIGDTLLVTPALRAIHRAYPHAAITFLGHPKRVEIVAHLPELQKVGPITKLRAQVMARVARKHYDLAFVYGFDRALVEYAVRVSERVVAFSQGDAALDAKLYRAVSPPPVQSAHSVLLNLTLTDALGIPHAGYALAYRVTHDETLWARGTIAAQVPPDRGPLIGLQVASFPTKAYRDWPIEHFIALCERVLAAYPRAHFLIFGGDLEADRTGLLAVRFAAHATLFAGKLSLRETAALMSRLDLYVGVDTGPTHIAGTMGIPMVVLYHCYSPARLIAPLEHPRLHAIDHPRVGGGPETPMAEIPVERVWREVDAVLAAQPAAEAARAPA